MADIADEMIYRLIEGFRPVDERDRQGLIDLLDRHGKEVQEYIAAIKARPIVAKRVDPANLPAKWQQQRPLNPPRSLNRNGGQR